MVHPDPVAAGLELVRERFTRSDLGHICIGVDLTRVEVDGVLHCAVVDDGDAEQVADAPAQYGTWHFSVEGPDGLGDAGRDLALAFGDVPGVLVDSHIGRGRQRRITVDQAVVRPIRGDYRSGRYAR